MRHHATPPTGGGRRIRGPPRAMATEASDDNDGKHEQE